MEPSEAQVEGAARALFYDGQEQAKAENPSYIWAEWEGDDYCPWDDTTWDEVRAVYRREARVALAAAFAVENEDA